MTPIDTPPIIHSFTMSLIFDSNILRLIVDFTPKALVLLANIHKHHAENNLPVLALSNPKTRPPNTVSLFQKALKIAVSSKNVDASYRVNDLMRFTSLKIKTKLFRKLELEQLCNLLKIADKEHLREITSFISDDFANRGKLLVQNKAKTAFFLGITVQEFKNKLHEYGVDDS